MRILVKNEKYLSHIMVSFASDMQINKDTVTLGNFKKPEALLVTDEIESERGNAFTLASSTDDVGNFKIIIGMEIDGRRVNPNDYARGALAATLDDGVYLHP